MYKAVLYYFVSWQFSERNLIKNISTDKLFFYFQDPLPPFLSTLATFE